MSANADSLLAPAALFVVRAETTRAVAEAVQARTEMLENLALVVWLDEDQPRGRLESFHATPAAAEAALASLRAELDGLAPGAGAAAAIAVLPPEDWAESWKRHFKPEHVSERLWVKPTWAACAAAPGEIVIELDPGLSFGTGQHGTTRACLCLLDACARQSAAGRLTDLGTGSGILAIAAARLGWTRVLALDNDPAAVRIATANAAANGVAAAVTVREGGPRQPVRRLALGNGRRKHSVFGADRTCRRGDRLRGALRTVDPVRHSRQSICRRARGLPGAGLPRTANHDPGGLDLRLADRSFHKPKPCPTDG